jgi:hypothetical protein
MYSRKCQRLRSPILEITFGQQWAGYEPDEVKSRRTCIFTKFGVTTRAGRTDARVSKELAPESIRDEII